MPLLIQLEDLRPGMRLSEPIVTNGKVMLQGGKELSSSDIKALRRRYPDLTVRVGDPLLDGIVDFEDDSRERSIAAEAQQKVAESLSEVQERFTARASLGGADFRVLQSSVHELVEYLRGNPTSAAVVNSCLDGESYLSMHTGNVFYLSMVLGSTVLDYVAAERKRQTAARALQIGLAQDLTPLGLGAMCMDLGMLPLQKLFASDAPLTDGEREAISDHPNVGADMLPESFPAAAKMIVRTHHENFDGSGYPQKLTGDKVHVFTRIVRIADAYDAATSSRVYKGGKSPARVLWEMLAGPYRRFYDPRLMRAFAKLIQPFPIGCKLRLEDGRYAAVVKYNRTNPFKPTVIVAFDSRNQPLARDQLTEPVDLSARSDMRIKSSLGEDLSFIYGLESTQEAAAPEELVTLLDSAYP